MGQLDAKAKELEQQIDSIEFRMDRLRNLYEQYFQGIERIEPSTERKALKKVLREVHGNIKKVRSTALKFRINQMVARMASFENYWNRICRRMEEGTYQRDLFKAHYRAKNREEEEQEAGDQETAGAQAEAGEQAAAPRARPPGQQGKRDAGNAVPDQQINAIYTAYMTAKRRCKESTKGLTRNALASSIRKQVPTIMKQYKCKNVEFKVVIKKGKAVLKAVPKF